jgi:hypothetical protein
MRRRRLQSLRKMMKRRRRRKRRRRLIRRNLVYGLLSFGEFNMLIFDVGDEESSSEEGEETACGRDEEEF